MSDENTQKAEYERMESDHLRRGLCPASGLRLHADGNGPPGLSCDMCDCFGYDPAEVGHA
jgi:hypothetical protein